MQDIISESPKNGAQHQDGHTNGHHATLEPKVVTPRLLKDSLQAQHGALRHLLTFDQDKIKDAKGTTDKNGKRGREITPDHFQNPTAQKLAYALWTFYEDREFSYDAETFDKYLLNRGDEDVYELFNELQEPTKQRPPRWEDALHSVLNWRKVEMAEAKAHKKAEKIAAKEREINARGLPTIETNNGQLSDKLGEFANAIARYNGEAPTLFHSAHGLTEIGRNARGEAVLRPVVRERLQVLASNAATWISTTEREGPRDVAPPRDFCTQFLVSPDVWQNVPDVERILTAPFVDRHGTICATPGYHASEQIWLSLPDGFELPDTTPSAPNVSAAKSLLVDKLLGEVAFANSASRANALGLMLLPFVQRTIDGFTPLHLFDAPTQSSGKTYAAQICIAPFREIAPSAYKKNNEENQKELFARLLSGPSHVFTDNITGDLSDPTLATAITEKYLDGRVLGLGRTEVVSTRAVYVGTSNNAQLCSDAVSRSIVIRLDTGEENPEARQFRFKPVRYIAQNRPQVLAAIFTLVRAWLEAGRPLSTKPTRSRFDEWEQTIGGILETIGIEGFLDNYKDARAEMNPEAAAWREFVTLWHKTHGQEYVATKDLLETALKCDELAALVGEKEGKARRFGLMLQKKRDKVFGDFKILRAAEKSNGASKWRVSSETRPKTPENSSKQPEKPGNSSNSSETTTPPRNVKNSNTETIFHTSHNGNSFPTVATVTDTESARKVVEL